MTTLAASDAIAAEETEPPTRGLRVEVANQTNQLVDLARIKAAVAAVLGGEASGAAAISVAIVGDAEIHVLNRRYLEHDYPTDVLTFCLSDEPELEGEIVVSWDTAAREAAAIGWSALDELTLYVVHGALHLAGYDDLDPDDAWEMRRAEAAALDRLGIRRAPTDARWSAAHDSSRHGEAPKL